MPDFPEGTSPALTQHYHVRAEKIVQEVGKITESKVEYESLRKLRNHPHDIPGDWFTGPF